MFSRNKYRGGTSDATFLSALIYHYYHHCFCCYCCCWSFEVFPTSKTAIFVVQKWHGTDGPMDRRTYGPTDGPTDRQTDRRTDTTSYGDAWSHLTIEWNGNFKQFIWPKMINICITKRVFLLLRGFDQILNQRSLIRKRKNIERAFRESCAATWLFEALGFM